MNLRRLLLLLFLFPVSVQFGNAQGRTRLYSAPITVSTGVENIPGADGGYDTESTLLIEPVRPVFSSETRRTTFRFSYSPELELVRNGSRNLGYWNHAADVAYGHTTGRRTRFTIGHSFTKTSDPLRSFQDSLFVLSRNSFRQNATVVAFRHDFTRRTSFGTRFDNTLTSISAANRLEGTYLNGYGLAGTLSLTRHLTQRQKFTGSYSMLKFSPYQFPNDVDPDVFLSTLPTVRAGISRFAMTIGLASAEASSTPSGMLGGSMTNTPEGAPGTPTPVAPGVGAPVIGPIAALDYWKPSGPVTAGLSSTPPGAIPIGSALPAGPLALHAAFGIPAATVTATEDPAANTKKLLGDPFHVAVGTYSFQKGPGTTFEVSGGAMTDRDVSYLAGAQIDKSSDNVWMTLGIHHFVSLYGPIPVKGIPTAFGNLQPPGTKARSDYSAAMLTIDARITRNTDVGVSASVSRSKANFVEHNIRSMVGSARFTHWLNNRFGLFASVDSILEDRVQAGMRAFNRQRYFGGIQIRMSAPRSTRANER